MKFSTTVLYLVGFVWVVSIIAATGGYLAPRFELEMIPFPLVDVQVRSDFLHTFGARVFVVCSLILVPMLFFLYHLRLRLNDEADASLMNEMSQLKDTVTELGTGLSKKIDTKFGDLKDALLPSQQARVDAAVPEKIIPSTPPPLASSVPATRHDKGHGAV